MSEAPKDPVDRLYTEAAAGAPDARATVVRRHEALILRILDGGRARYGELGIDLDACTRGFARVLAAEYAAETAAAGRPPGIDAVVELLVLPDIYLAEGLLAGTPAAWTAFETVLEAAFRSVRAHFAGQTSRIVLGEIRESILGTFFLDRKIATYRATAPIGAWARQVMFNIFRQRMNARRSGREAATLSQIGGEEAEVEGLLPPSREPPPPEALERAEWSELLARAVPEALAVLDRDERRMLEVLPTKVMTQVQLCKEMGISPFKLNRWYKEVRERFLREVTHRIRLQAGLDEIHGERLVAYLAGLWGGGAEDRDFRQEGGPR